MSEPLPTDRKSELELEKLHLEIESLRRSLRPWYRTASALVVAIGGALALLTVLMQWRIAKLDVDRAEWKTTQLEEREQGANRSLEEKDREMAAVEAQLSKLQREAGRREAQSRKTLEQTQGKVRDLQRQRSSLEDEAAKSKSHLAELQLAISGTERARKEAEDEVLALRNEVAILDSRKTELLTGIINDPTASQELRAAAITVAREEYARVREEYARKKSEAQSAFLKADQFSMYQSDQAKSSAERLFHRAGELQKEIQHMESLWPWLREPTTAGKPD